MALTISWGKSYSHRTFPWRGNNYLGSVAHFINICNTGFVASANYPTLAKSY
jgi:hypothetical protein